MIWEKHGKATTIKEVVEANTGVTVEELLSPKEKPFLYGLQEAISLTRQCISLGYTIFVIGDYDVDGIMSCSILRYALEHAGKVPLTHIPRRFSDGYGLNMNIVKAVIAHESEKKLMFTVDNGITAVEQIKAAKDAGIKVIIMDHHMPGKDGILPPADVIVNPHATGKCEFDGYCGAGLSYRFACELIPGDDCLKELEIFAGIATVADVMPLIGDNRRLVKNSLDAINKGLGTPGLRSLIRAMNIEYATESDYGFRLGPAINASGRLKDSGAIEVFKLMTWKPDPFKFNDEEEMDALCFQIVERNERRKTLSREGAKLAETKLPDPIGDVIVVYDGSFHEGVVGIIAGDLSEKYHRPAIVFTDSSQDGVIKGSARSDGVVPIDKMLHAASKYIVKYGGHAGAAGLSVETSQLDNFKDAVSEYIRENAFSFDDETAVVRYDLEISEDEIPSVAEAIQKYAPYGEGNPAPVFKVKGFKLAAVAGSFWRTLGKERQGIKLFGREANAVNFEAAEEYFSQGSPLCVDIIGTLYFNYYKGTKTPTVEMKAFREHRERRNPVANEIDSLLTF